MRKTTLAAMAAILFATFAEAIDPVAWEVPAGVRTIAKGDIVADSAAITAEAYPDADTVLMDSVTFETYQPDGTSVCYDDTYTKILTEKGRRGEATSSLYFNAFYGDIALVAAEVVKGDGSTVPVDLARNAEVMVDPGSMSANIYDPNDKILKVSYPDLEIGDIVRLAFRRTTSKARVPDVWSDYQTFESTAPIRRYSYFVSSPAERPVKRCVLRGEIPGTITNYEVAAEGGRTLHAWDIHDVPQLFAEPDMPPAHTVCQRVLTSTAASWGELSRWYWNLCKPRLDAVTDDMKATVADILAKSTEQQQNRIWNIYTWVSQNIRYMGVTTETEAPGYEPHDVSTTFEKRYGVCRDKAALLVAMLRLAQIDAYPVLIHVGEKRDPDVPMTFFNHAIVGVREADGSITLMDPTNENSHDLLPAYLAGKSYLVASPTGDDLRTSPDVPASANMLFAKSKGTIDDKGTLSLATTLEFDGLNDAAYRSSFIRMPEEKRRQFFEGLVKRAIAGARLESLEIKPADLRDTDTPLSVTFRASAPDFPAEGAAAVLVDLPWFSSSIGYVNFILGSTGLEKRRFPLETEDACGVEESITLDFASLGQPIAIPDAVSFKTNGVTFSQKVSVADGSVKASRRFELNLTSYPPEIYPEFKKTLHEMEKANDQRVVVEKGPSPLDEKADVRILSRQIDFDVADASTWTTTVSTVTEILSYAGRKSHSELKISYNPAWEEVELLGATVSNANGQVQAVRKEEINVMDAPWVAAAPRYPAAKTMVVSLPGVEIGSVIRTGYRIVSTRQPFVSFAHVFQDTDPVDKDTLVLRSGDNILIHYNLYNREGFEENVVTNGGVEVYTLTAKSPATLPKEDYLPPARFFAKAIVASSGDWTDYATLLDDAVAAATAYAVRSNASTKAFEICDGIIDEREKLRAIRDFVVKNIRLAGPSFTDLPLAATPADVTLRDGYGNLLDRAVLLDAMLMAAGFDCRVVFADSASPLIDDITRDTPESRYAFPDTGVFTYPLVEVTLDEDETPIYLGDTDQYAELGATDFYGHFMLAKPVSEEFDPISIVIADESFWNRLLMSRLIELDADGTAMISTTNIYCGTDAAAIRKQYAEMTPEKRSRHFQELVGAVSVAAKPVGDLFVDADAYPHHRGYTVKAPGYAARTGDTLTLTLPAPGNVLPLRSDVRELPLCLPQLDDKAVVTEIILPENTAEVLICPSDFNWDYTDLLLGRYTQTVLQGTREDGRRFIQVNTLFLNRERALAGAEFAKAILEMNRRMARPDQRTIVIRLSK